MEQETSFALALPHSVGLLVLSLLLLGIVLELLRRDLLKERYALLWMATSLAGVVIGIFPGISIKLAELLRFQYITLLFVLSFLFLLGLVLSFSVILSMLSERNRLLTQEVAMLSHRLEQLEQKGADEQN